MDYVQCFVMSCIVVVKSHFFADLYDWFTLIIQGYFTGTGAVLSQCQWSNLDEYG